MINADDESCERCGSPSEVDVRSVQGDRIDSSVVRPPSNDDIQLTTSTKRRSVGDR